MEKWDDIEIGDTVRIAVEGVVRRFRDDWEVVFDAGKRK